MEPTQDWAVIWRLSTGARMVPPSERAAFVEVNSPDEATASLVMALLQNSDLSIADSHAATYPARPGGGRSGLRIGRYIVEELLGSGAFGEVYSAKDTELGRPVALKFLRAEALDSRWTPARFLREAKATSALNHPNIVTVYEIIHSPEGLVIAMERIDGVPLRALCGSPRPAGEIVRYGAQIARALAAAHSRGVIHRDIKPENLMVRRDGYVKVLDFGLAQGFGGENPSEPSASLRKGLPAGTFRYMSPEQACGKDLTPATDVFSLGLVLHELACGVHPFPGATAIETAYEIMHLRPKPLPASASAAALERVLLRLLEKNPKMRPKAAEAAELLESALEAKRQSSWARRTPVMAGAAVALLAGAIGVARFGTGRHPEGRAVDNLNIVNVTSLDGYEWGTSFSPDGQRIAFAWDGGGAKQQGIYTQAIAGGPVTAISRSPGEDFYPAWSPDGSRIAFVRRVGKGPGLTVMVAPSSGGEETKVTEISDNEGYSYPVAWYPAGDALLVRTMDSNRRVSILRAPLNGAGLETVTSGQRATWDGTPAPAPDGARFAFIRSSHSNRAEICVQEFSGSQARCFAPGPSPSGLAWASGGRSLYAGRARSLSQIDVVTGAETKISEGAFPFLAGDRQGKHLAFSYTHRDHNVWRYAIGAGQAPVKIIAASEDDIEPAYSPDGKRIVFRSRRSGPWEFWISNSDGSEQRQLTRFKGVVESPRWSPDGRRIAFWRNGPHDRFVRIYTIDPDSGEARPVTPDQWPAQYPIWTADGKSILFTGGEATGIWRIAADGSGTAERVAQTTWLDAFVSSDGGTVYFTKGYETPGVWRMPVSGGSEPELIPGSLSILNYRYWDVVNDVAYFVDVGTNAAVRKLDLKTAQSQTLFPLNAEFFLGPRGVAVSPDGKSILIVKLDTLIGDIKMIEGLN